MDIKEFNKFMDDLKILVLKHPIVADWFVEISDRKDTADTPQTDCGTCKHNKLEWYSEECDGCCKAHSNYEPQTETKGVRYCNECKWFRNKQVCGRCRSRNLFAEADAPQTESTGSPIGDYRDGVGAWQTDKLTEEEFDTMIAKGLLGQTDCQW